MFNLKNTYLSVNNIYAPPVLKSDGTNLVESKNQFNLNLTQKLSDFWSFTTSQHLIKNKLKFHGINAKILYEDECLGASFNWQEFIPIIRKTLHQIVSCSFSQLKKYWKVTFRIKIVFFFFLLLSIVFLKKYFQKKNLKV